MCFWLLLKRGLWNVIKVKTYCSLVNAMLVKCSPFDDLSFERWLGLRHDFPYKRL